MQLKTRDPQKANQVQNLINNKSNPMNFYKEIMKDKTPEEMQKFYSYIQRFGVNEQTIEQLKSGINTD